MMRIELNIRLSRLWFRLIARVSFFRVVPKRFCPSRVWMGDFGSVGTSGDSRSCSFVAVLLGLIFSVFFVVILTYGFVGFCFKVDTIVCLSVMLPLYLPLPCFDSPLLSSYISNGSTTLMLEVFPDVKSWLFLLVWCFLALLPFLPIREAWRSDSYSIFSVSRSSLNSTLLLRLEFAIFWRPLATSVPVTSVWVYRDALALLWCWFLKYFHSASLLDFSFSYESSSFLSILAAKFFLNCRIAAFSRSSCLFCSALLKVS